MFTGLIKGVGKVLKREGDTLWLEFPPLEKTPAIGDSICVSGVCLTVADSPKGRISKFQVSPETFSKTNLGSLTEGSLVNIEPAAQASSSLDGHILQGHVDEVGRIAEIEGVGDYTKFIIQYSPENAGLVVTKGSIAVNGISLTVNSIEGPDRFSVMIIPHTLKMTCLAKAKTGDLINLEFDILGKYVLRLMETRFEKVSAR